MLTNSAFVRLATAVLIRALSVLERYFINAVSRLPSKNEVVLKSGQLLQ